MKLHKPQTIHKKTIDKYFLSRRKLRDFIIILSIGSSLYYDINSITKFVSFFILGTGYFVHYISKGILISVHPETLTL